MARLILIRGYPGSGKTTLGKGLQGAGCGRFIDHNQILTFIASITGDDDGIYDDIASLELAMARKLLRQGQDVIVARGFSSVSSMQPYFQTTETVGATWTVLRINVPENILVERVKAPERQLDFSPTVTQDALQLWMSRNPLEALRGEIAIDGSLSIDIVLENTLNILREK